MSRQKFEMTQEDLDKLISAGKQIPLIMLHLGMPRSPQERANDAWRELGERMGFEYMTVLPIDGESPRFFTAESTTVAGE